MNNQLPNALLFIRLTVALVLVIWTVDKFLNPAHAIKIFDYYYFIPANIAKNVMTSVAVAEVILILLFVIGRFKSVTYLLVLVIHAVSTIMPFQEYLDPYNGNMLFFAAWPMLAACYTLYVCREQDTRLNF